MSPVITLHCLTTSSTRCSYGFNNSNSRFNALVEPTRGSSVFAKVKSQSSASKFNNNPDWKTKFKDDSEDRFRLPHVTDIFPDAVSMPSTFSPNMRTPRTSDFPGYPLDEDWYGYINDNDRVLLKTIYYSSSTSAGAKCIDPGCNWVEQSNMFSLNSLGSEILLCINYCQTNQKYIPCFHSYLIVVTLEIYDVTIVGIPFGYRGFSDEELTEVPLSRKVVQNIHLSGGRSLLGVSRGGPGVSEIVDNLKERGINMLFVLGGNDTHAGANAIHNELIYNFSPNLTKRYFKFLVYAYRLATVSNLLVVLVSKYEKYFKEIGVHADVKYIDPTYMIRACRANAADEILCTVLGQNAVHGAFAGFSGITVSTCNTHYAYFPIPEVISHPKLDPNSRMWHRCLTSTGQPDFI
uniref:Phosphofructokinase domain-containing protein n=1 Tax=Glycine max TaxID=3847 RepID=A0A0R0L0W7_SOYBN